MVSSRGVKENVKYSRDTLLEFLSQQGINYEIFEHPAVFTVEEANLHLRGVPGQGTKNLFLRDDKGKRHILLSVSEHKQVDLKALSRQLGIKSLSLASPERLSSHLGILPGSVTLFAALNDHEKNVEVMIDEELLEQELLQCHPLVNTSTVVVRREDVLQTLRQDGHQVRAVSVPTR